MPIRFQADADLNQVLVSSVVRRVHAVDFRTEIGGIYLAHRDLSELRVNYLKASGKEHAYNDE